MPDYRVFKQNETLTIYSSAEMVCETDAGALVEASNIADDCPAYEVWCGARRVACIVNELSRNRPEATPAEPPYQAAAAS